MFLEFCLGTGKSFKVIVIAVAVPVSVCVLLLGAAYCLQTRRRNKLIDETKDLGKTKKLILLVQTTNFLRIPFFHVDEDDLTSTETQQFQFSEIEEATNKFSESNKLGHGGFGEVYKVLNSCDLT